jgi:Tol biopolymer transport system component
LIAYEADNDEGELCLWMVDAHGLSAAKLDRRWFASFHYWSPDSRSIAYFASPSEDRNACLRQVDVVNGDVHDLAILRVEDDEGEPVAAEPAWSPDGAYIAFASYQAEEADGSSYLYRVNRDGSGRQRLISDQPRFDVVRELSWGRDA